MTTQTTFRDIIFGAIEGWMSPPEIAEKLGMFCANGTPYYNNLYPHLSSFVRQGRLEKRFRKNQARVTEYRALP